MRERCASAACAAGFAPEMVTHVVLSHFHGDHIFGLYGKENEQAFPNAEIIIYLFSPVPTEGSELYKQILDAGFSFPEQLEDWILPSWENFDLRKNPLTPWLKPYMIDTIQNFEVVNRLQEIRQMLIDIKEEL
mgnify:CR=1 FL=1